MAIRIITGFFCIFSFVMHIFGTSQVACFVHHYGRNNLFSNKMKSMSDNSLLISENDNNFTMISSISPIDLQLHTCRKPPAEFLSYLSKECEKLGIDAFDSYGDFHDTEQPKSYLRRFEAEVATMFGKEDGVFCLSGCMAQSIVLAINARKTSTISNGTINKTKAFMCHPTSHLLLHENDHFYELLGMQAIVLDHTYGQSKQQNCDTTRYNEENLEENGRLGMEPIRLSHVQDAFASLNEATKTVSSTTVYPHPEVPINTLDLTTFIIELPHREIGGKLTPWNEVEEIATICKNHGVHYHCDGARVFEASAGYG